LAPDASDLGPALRIQLCGPLAVERGGRRVDAGLPGRQGRLLLAYLVVHRHREVRRDELVEAIWPGELATADAGLNPLLSKIRRALGPDVVDGRSTLRFRADPVWVDLEAAAEAVHRAESAVATGSWSRAWGPAQVALFTAEREFLPAADGAWVDEQRRHLGEIRLRALEAYGLAGLGLGGTELAAAVRAGRQLVRLAPLRESGYQLLMRALAEEGNPAEALQVYTSLCVRLQEELGVPPSGRSRAVYDELLRA
jgi:DNA-binding SARP family transcriptional activator